MSIPDTPSTTPPSQPATTVPRPRTSGAEFVEDCNQIDGPLATWQSSDLARRVEVVANRCSTNRNTSPYSGIAAHGLDLSGDFEITVRITAPKIISDGGVNVWLVDAAGNGWGIFVGNAVHIQKVTAFAHVNLTNVGVPGEGTPGVRASVIRFTRVGATGLLSAYLDGAPWGQTTDTDRMNAGTRVAVVLKNAQSPDHETSFDDLVITGAIRS